MDVFRPRKENFHICTDSFLVTVDIRMSSKNQASWLTAV